MKDIITIEDANGKIVPVRRQVINALKIEEVEQTVGISIDDILRIKHIYECLGGVYPVPDGKACFQYSEDRMSATIFFKEG